MRLGFPAAALALVMSAPASFAADAKTVAAELAALTAGSLAIDDAKVDAWLKATFTGDNACGDPGNPNLTLEQTCQWFAEGSDGSAPDMIVGIKGDKIATAITSTVDLKSAGWECSATQTDYQVCFPNATDQAERDKYSAEWKAFLNSAG